MSTDTPKLETAEQETQQVEAVATDLISPGIRFNLEDISKEILPITSIWQRQDKPEPVSTTEKSDCSTSDYEDDGILEKSTNSPVNEGEVVIPKRKRKRKRKRKTKSPEVPIPRERPYKRRKLAKITQPENFHIRYDDDGVPDRIIDDEPSKLKARIIQALTINLKVFETFVNNEIVETEEVESKMIEIAAHIIEEPPHLKPRIIKAILIKN